MTRPTVTFWQFLRNRILNNILFGIATAVVIWAWYQQNIVVTDRQARFDELIRVDNFTNLTSHEYKRCVFETDMVLILSKQFRDSSDFAKTFIIKAKVEATTVTELIFQLSMEASTNDTLKVFKQNRIDRLHLIDTFFDHRNVLEIRKFLLGQREAALSLIDERQLVAQKAFTSVGNNFSKAYRSYIWWFILGAVLIAVNKFWKSWIQTKK